MVACIQRLALAGAIALSALPAWAQTAHDLGPLYGYGPMGDGWDWSGWSWLPGMIFGPLLMLIVVGAVVALALWFVRGFGRIEPYGCGRAALDILEQRFARGEIDKVEFEDKRKLLQS